MSKLPIEELKTQFQKACGQGSVVVEAPTGSGKSTQLPLWSAEQGRVLVIEPRRMACRALAEHVSSLYPCEPGEEVGYAIRFESHFSAKSRIVFATPGVALRWFAQDKLQSFSIIVLDEFHERRSDTDLLAALLKNNNSKLVLTSATVEGKLLAAYLHAERLEVQGRTYEVRVSYLGERELPSTRKLEERVYQGVRKALDRVAEGDVLVFLPGKGEIRAAEKFLSQKKLKTEILPLHASLAHREQDKALKQVNQRRIILATNVAETSLTLPGVRAVVDTGLERRTHHRGGRTALGLHSISRAAAEQRKGRAGRLGPGLCVRLWGEQAKLEAFTPPEVQREELTEVVLGAAVCGCRARDLDFPDPLPQNQLQKAENLLNKMQALDETGQITEHGKKLFSLPLDPLFAHLLTAIHAAPSKAMMADLAAALSVQGNILPGQLSEKESKILQDFFPDPCDATTLIRLIRYNPPSEIPVQAKTLKEARQIAEQIRQTLDLPLLSADTGLDRASFLQEVVRIAPELVFVRRKQQKRRQYMGNEGSEVLVGQFSRFPEKEEAALVFDQHSTPGKKGTQQTLNLATCLAPISFSQLNELGVGQLIREDPLWEEGRVMLLEERIYAGRTLHSQYIEPQGQELCRALARLILKERFWPELGKKIREDVSAWNLYLHLGHAQGEKVEAEKWLTNKLAELGLEESADIQLLDKEDLAFDGIPEWERDNFDRLYPRHLHLEELEIAISYEPEKWTITLQKTAGRRKNPPTRRELPPWSRKWTVRYREGSKVVLV
jgi:ATP-dependent helicase HrpB